MKKILLLALPVISIYSEFSQASCQSDGQVLGSICTTAADFCPRGYTSASGALLPIMKNQALFSLLGTKYGGDGVTTFALPDLRGRMPVGTGMGNGLRSVSLGEIRGAETVTLHKENLPKIEVPIPEMKVTGQITIEGAVTQGTGSAQAGITSGSLAGTATSGRTNVDLYSSSDKSVRVTTDLKAQGTASVNGGYMPISILPPQLGLTFCVATIGIYPTRP